MQNQNEIQRLEKLSLEDLFIEAQCGVKEEASATLKVLYVLREIEKRRAFAGKNYASLFDFCVDYLGYKKDAAYRRIAAMRALKDLPEVEAKIKAGALSLTTLAQVQTHFTQKKRKNEALTKTQKLEIVSTLENKSTRQTEQFFLEVSPREIPKEKFRAINAETDELTIAMPKRVQEKIKRLKMYMGAQKSSVDTVEAIERALDIAIVEYEKQFKKSEVKVGKSEVKVGHSIQRSSDKKPKRAIFAAPGKTNPISIHVKRLIWKRDQGQCAFTDSTTGGRCASRHWLEVDHIICRALGGSNDPRNLRLICRAHNQWAAIQQLGLKKMSPYLEASG